MPGLLPAYLCRHARGVDGVIRNDGLRDAAIEFLNAPYGVVSLFVDGGMLMFTERLGELGSFYLFFFGLWFLVLGISTPDAQ